MKFDRTHRPDPARALNALHSISPDCDRESWIKIGMAAKAAGLQFDDFAAWSSAAPSYSASDCRDAWRSIQPNGGVGPASLFYEAKANGWQDTAKPASNRPPPPAPRLMPPVNCTAPERKPAPGQAAAEVWARCEPATNAHPYVEAKGAAGVPLDGLRVLPAGDALRVAGEPMAGALTVPIRNLQGDLMSLQLIPPPEVQTRLKAAGKPAKLNLPGHSLGSGFFTVGELRPGCTVLVAEGLGTAWACWQATGHPSIATFGAARFKSVTAALRQHDTEARIILCPDVGKEPQAAAVASAVGAACCTMPQGWPDNADLHDLAEREGLEAVAKAIASASAPAAPEPRYKLLNAAHLEALPPLEWRIKGVLPSQGLAQIYGPSKAGKSFLCFDMMCAIAEGRTWFGYRVNAAPVIYLALEGAAGFKLRAEAWKRQNGRPLPNQLSLVMQDFRINSPQDVEDLAAVLPPGAVIAIDTQNRAAPDADENSSRDMGLIIEGAKALQARNGGLIVLVAHTGKDASRGPRGHSSQIPAVDAAVEVTRNGDRRTWRADKVKDGADGAEHDFLLEVIELGFDADGDKLTSCAVAAQDERTPRSKLMTPSQGMGMSAYQIACEEGHGELDEDGNFIGLGVEAWRLYFYQISTADTPEAKKKAFQRSRKDLTADGLMTVKNDIYRTTNPGISIQEPQFKAAALLRRDTGQAGQSRDNTGTCPDHERDIPGHTPLGVSRCPDGAPKMNEPENPGELRIEL